MEDKYPRAFWTLFWGTLIGLGLMALGSGILVIPMIQVGIFLQVATFIYAVYLAYEGGSF